MRWVIEPYLGYGTHATLRLTGRVLAERGPIESSHLDSKWRNLVNTFRRFRTAEVAGARVCARAGGVENRGATDADGYFWVELELDRPLEDGPWVRVNLTLQDATSATGAHSGAEAQVLVPPQSARFGVISDIDDTVITTNVTSTARMLSTVLFSNAYGRTPFDGVAAFYRALQRGASGAEANPIFYVSNGPWNFFGLIVEFLRLNDIPLGPLFLRDFSPRMVFPGRARHSEHKRLHIERILAVYERLPFVLIGDSGERDPEIYAEVLARHPQRIRAIYIRCVHRRPERVAALSALAEAANRTGTRFVLAADSAAAGLHAAESGLIAADALEDVRAACA